jgi:GTP-binding protein
MKPVIALVGRPNVGKSTLFNVLTRSRDALVADFPGLTRDRKYGIGRLGGRDYLVVDTGGFSEEREGIAPLMAEQTRIALAEAHAVVLVVDGREGLSVADEAMAGLVRGLDRPMVVAVNKTDGLDPDQASAEFYALGLPGLHAIAAAHGRGVWAMIEALLATLPPADTGPAAAAQEGNGVRVAFIGRPNVGKSTLINRLLGAERLLTDDSPGTTRDSVEVPFERSGRRYILVDTAGVRRRNRIRELVERFSVIKSLQAVDAADAVVMVLDASEAVSDQDASLLGLVLESGRALVLAVNKWDRVAADERRGVRAGLERRLPFLGFAERHMVSALRGTGLDGLLKAVDRAQRSAMISVPTSQLSRLLEQAVAAHPPPMVRGRRIKLRFAHQGGSNPPRIVIHGNQTERLPGAYRRYLMNFYTESLGLKGAAVRLEFKTGANPYAGRRNTLTPRQQRKRQRLLRRVKRRS